MGAVRLFILNTSPFFRALASFSFIIISFLVVSCRVTISYPGPALAITKSFKHFSRIPYFTVEEYPIGFQIFCSYEVPKDLPGFRFAGKGGGWRAGLLWDFSVSHEWSFWERERSESGGD